MKYILTLLLAFAFTAPVCAQERGLEPSRSTIDRESPRLAVQPLTLWERNGLAEGMAQAWDGSPVFLPDRAVPQNSIVRLYGAGFQNAGQVLVWLRTAEGDYILPAAVYPVLWFKFDALVFRLPQNARGVVYVLAVGAHGQSNEVRFFVE